MHRFYIHIENIDLQQVILPEEESKHAVRVLRLKTGDKIEIINGLGGLLIGEIIAANPKQVIVQKVEYYFEEKNREGIIHIAIAPTKNNDRLEWFIEKATELGVDEITPLLCSNSERKKIKLERFQKILISAVKQSKRLHAPIINDLTKFKDFIQQNKGGFIAHCDDNFSKDHSLLQALNKSDVNKRKAILIGPEGDFDKKEIELALKNDYLSVTLGKNRLRTETAGIYACASYKFHLELKDEN